MKIPFNMFSINNLSLRCASALPLTFSTLHIKIGPKSMLAPLPQNIQRNATVICQLSKTVKRISHKHFPEKSRVSSQFFSKMSTPAPEKSSCIFCNIVNKLESTEILFEDDRVCVFMDIKPASSFHILTVPKRHIEDAKCLTSADKELVQHMLLVAKDILQKNNQSVDDARLGYHWPPFRSVHHLHLHAIAPVSEMGFIGKLIFRKDSYWFVSPEYIESRL